MNWQTIIASIIGVLSGSVMATVIKIAYDRWQSKVPKVYYLLEHDKLFNDSDAGSGMKAFVSVYEDNQVYPFKIFSLVRLRFKNVTSQDFPTFSFGITLPDSHGVIKAVSETKDRYHLADCQQTPTAKSPCQTLDFVCAPYNRGDDLHFTLYITSKYSLLDESRIVVATAAPVTLVKVTDPSAFRPRDKIADALALFTLVCAGVSILMCGLTGLGAFSAIHKMNPEIAPKVKPDAEGKNEATNKPE